MKEKNIKRMFIYTWLSILLIFGVTAAATLFHPKQIGLNPATGDLLVLDTADTAEWKDPGAIGIGVAGADTQVQFNDADVFGAEAAFTYDKAADLLTASLINGTSLSMTTTISAGTALESNSTGAATGDFRAQSDNEDNAIFLDASEDILSIVPTEGLYIGDGDDDVPIYIREMAAAAADVANFGQPWVKTDGTLWFTVDTGVDHQITPGLSAPWVWVSGLINDGPNTLTHDATGVYYPVTFHATLYEVGVHIASWTVNDAQDTVTCDIYYGNCGSEGQITNFALTSACTTCNAEADVLIGDNGKAIYCVITVTQAGALDDINGLTVEAFYRHDGIN